MELFIYCKHNLRQRSSVISFPGPSKRMPKTQAGHASHSSGSWHSRALWAVCKSFHVSQIGLCGMELPRWSPVPTGNSLFTHLFLQLGTGWPSHLCISTDKVRKNSSKENFLGGRWENRLQKYWKMLFWFLQAPLVIPDWSVPETGHQGSQTFKWTTQILSVPQEQQLGHHLGVEPIGHLTLEFSSWVSPFVFS